MEAGAPFLIVPDPSRFLLLGPERLHLKSKKHGMQLGRPTRTLVEMGPSFPERLSAANLEFRESHPGESGKRQPVHVVYGGAHLFKADTCGKLGKLAERALADFAPDAATLAEAIGLPDRLAATLYERVVEKLRREPVEDYRIDFEDGYGIRPDAEEDAAAAAAAEQMAKGLADGTLPPFTGFRIKPLDEELKARALRTLGRFLSVLSERTGGRLPDNFVVTLPKITVPEQVTAFLHALERFPDVNVELMVETPSALMNLANLVELAEGRCVAVHFGPYDYTSSLGITSTNQHLLHPACDFARSMMQISLAGRGLRLSDGPTNIMPVPIHRGDGVSAAQRAENRTVVHRAWKLHYDHVRHALYNGFYQGWDLHPAQLPIRYAAIYAFFLEGLDAASERVRNFIGQAAQATRIGDVFDDAATGQGLLNYFLRATACGAIPESDIPALTGLTLKQLRTGSFVEILKTL
jgi:citrate lyase beta subunit